MPQNSKRIQFYTDTMTKWKIDTYCQKNKTTFAAFCRTAVIRLLSDLDSKHGTIYQLDILQDIRMREDPPCTKRALQESISISKKSTS